MPWAVADYQVFKLTCPAGAGGAVQASLPAVPGGQLWRIEAIAVACDNTLTGTIPVVLGYDDLPDNGGTSTVPCCGTQGGSLDFADGTPVSVLAGKQFTLVFDPVDSGVIAVARLQVLLLTGSPGTAQPVAA